jgi:hypothetical protein
MIKAMLTLLLWLSAVAAVHAYDPLEVEDRIDYAPPDDELQEEAITLPERYDPNDLQHFSLKGDSDRFTYAIERKSLRTGDDGVSRFIVVIRSNQGAVNSSYEGLRCGHREYKVYAYGSGQGLTPLPGTDWQAIPKDAGGYRTILYEDLICNLQTGQANPPDAVFQAMRHDRLVNAPFINGGPD